MLITKYVKWVALGFILSGTAWGQFGNPFTIEAKLDGEDVVVSATVPDKHYLYVDEFSVVDGSDKPLTALSTPKTGTINDPISGKPKAVYDTDFTIRYRWQPSSGGENAFTVNYMGCNDETCFIPQSKTVALSDQKAPPTEKTATPAADTDWQKALIAFEEKGRATGYMQKEPFLAFLKESEGAEIEEKKSGIRLFLSDPEAFVAESGLGWALLFILIGGLTLNLTPCVLPMIPINLAIIGAGAQAGSKRRGFALGAAYGLGIALVYGGLGAVIVLTGSRFGAIQSTGWFNALIATIFLVLALAMFDLFHIDFSRFQSASGGAPGKPKGNFWVAVSMGSVAALLAGACVAPVVIAVLLLATSLGPQGLILPFVLGLGMALPWPFAGAGLSFLPKPGKWMEYVKYGFGVLILLFALYYANLSYRAYRPSEIVAAADESGKINIDGTTNAGLADVLNAAAKAGQPVFLDFWAHTCKNCLAMDKSTFKEPDVKTALASYVFVKYVADDMNDPDTQALLDHFKVQGLPTFIVLQP